MHKEVVQKINDFVELKRNIQMFSWPIKDIKRN